VGAGSFPLLLSGHVKTPLFSLSLIFLPSLSSSPLQVMKSKRSYAKQVERLVELFTDGWEDWQDPGLEEEEALEAAKEEEEKRKLKEKRKATLELMKKHEGHKHSKGKGKRV